MCQTNHHARLKNRLATPLCGLALLLALLLGWLFHAQEAAAEPGNGVRRNGALRVEGARLLNAAGQPLQLRGLSTHGIHWFPQYANPQAIRQTRALGANVFRVAMYADSQGGAYNESKEARERNAYLLTLAVDYALAEDMYAIIDWHLLKDETPLKHADSAVEFFREMSVRYAGNPAVIYEICNEPNGATTWQDIRAYAERVIPVIRENSPQALVLVGTPEFSSRVDQVRGAPLGFSNIMYVYHFYTGFMQADYESLLGGLLRDGFPLFITEWGLGPDEETGELELGRARAFVEFMRGHGLSWTNWSLCNKDESFSAIRSEVSKLHGWTEEDLTPSGKLVFRALSGLPF